MKRIFSIVSFIVITGCSINSINDKNVIKPLSQTKFVSNFNEIIDSLTFIPIVGLPLKFLTRVEKFLIDKDGNFIILDPASGVLVFNSNGEFLNKIGGRGRGENEYNNIEDVCMTSDGNYLIILDQFSLIKYKISNNKFARKINIPHENYDALCVSEDYLFLFSSNPDIESDFKKPFNSITQIDTQGKVIRKFLPRRDFVFSQGIFTKSFDGSYLMRPQEGDHWIYKIHNNKFSKLYKIDFEKEGIPVKYIFQSSDLTEGMRMYLFSNYYKLPLNIHLSNKHLYFSSIGPNAKQNDFIINRETLLGVRWKYEKKERNPVFILSSDSTNFYTFIDFCMTSNEAKGNIVDSNSTLKGFLQNYLNNKNYPDETQYFVKIKFK